MTSRKTIMAGTDTSRGINFQYACSIGFLIDFIAHPDWASIKFEGDKDIEDIVVFNEKNEILIRAQVKQKIDPYRWEPYEFRDVILSFADLYDSGVTNFMFIYAGAEGKSITNQIKPILLKIQHEGWYALSLAEKDTLSNLLNEQGAEFISKVQNRFIAIRRESVESYRISRSEKIKKDTNQKCRPQC